MFEILNPVGILVAAIAGYALDIAWYSPILFTKPWLDGLGKTKEEVMRP